MSFDYAGLAARAALLVARFGRSATILRMSATQPATPWDETVAGSASELAVTVVDMGIRDMYAPGGMITRRARVLLLAAAGVVPVKSDKVTLGSVTHEISEVRPLAPGGTDLVYEIEVAA